MRRRRLGLQSKRVLSVIFWNDCSSRPVGDVMAKRSTHEDRQQGNFCRRNCRLCVKRYIHVSCLSQIACDIHASTILTDHDLLAAYCFLVSSSVVQFTQFHFHFSVRWVHPYWQSYCDLKLWPILWPSNLTCVVLRWTRMLCTSCLELTTANCSQ